MQIRDGAGGDQRPVGRRIASSLPARWPLPTHWPGIAILRSGAEPCGDSSEE